jgi:WD40 repeat protein
MKFENYLILEGHLDSIKCLCILKDRRIISGSQDNIIKIWLFSRKGYICTNTINEHNASVSALININDEAFISSSYDKSIKIWIAVKN